MIPSVCGIVLAAGASSRFGGPKALALWRGGTLLSHAVETTAAACDGRVIVVTGGHADAVAAACTDGETVHNAEWRTGLGSSIACGIRAAMDRDAAAALLVPVDQPFVTTDHLRALVARALLDRVCVLSIDGTVTGPPACVPAMLFPALGMLTGETGLKSAVPDHAIIDAPGILRDIDTPDDLARLKQAAPGPE